MMALIVAMTSACSAGTGGQPDGSIVPTTPSSPDVPSKPTQLSVPQVQSGVFQTSPAPLSEEALKNAEYHSQDFTLSNTPVNGTIRLTDGKYEYKGPQSTLFMLQVNYLQSTAGDLNGDGTPDAVVVLDTNTGGSGVFLYLAALVNQDGQPDNVSTVFLGDRVKIDAVTIQSGVVRLEMVVQGTQDAMCCPSQKVTQEFVLKNNQLMP